MTSDQSSPRLQLAVSAGIFRDGKVLLVRRGREPAKGMYTFPGGRVEFGESLVDAVAREVREETGLTIDVLGLAGYREYLPARAAGLGHFVILPFAARWVSGEITLNDELDDAVWCVPGALGSKPITLGLEDIIQAAQKIAGP